VVSQATPQDSKSTSIGPATITIKPVKIPAGDIDLNAILYFPRDNLSGSGFSREPLPIVIFHHGYGGNIEKGNITTYGAPISLGVPCVALLYDCRGHGKSPGSRFQYNKTLDDVQRVIDFARQLEGVDPYRVGFVGVSLGGSIGLLRALPDARIKAIVGISCLDAMPLDFSAVPTTAGGRLVRWLLRMTGIKKRMEDRGPDPPSIAAFPGGTEDATMVQRLFLAHAKDDKFAKFASFSQLRERLHVPPEQCLVLDHGGHELRSHEQAVIDAVLAFLKARL
jgi:pimeloyl-ACP methyl ester carboxylesterase